MKDNGPCRVYQRGCEEGEYDKCLHVPYYSSKVVDCDFTALVYPKWIKVVTDQEPTKAVLTSNG